VLEPGAHAERRLNLASSVQSIGIDYRRGGAVVLHFERAQGDARRLFVAGSSAVLTPYSTGIEWCTQHGRPCPLSTMRCPRNLVDQPLRSVKGHGKDVQCRTPRHRSLAYVWQLHTCEIL
jgi:hypothetical protein